MCGMKVLTAWSREIGITAPSSSALSNTEFETQKGYHREHGRTPLDRRPWPSESEITAAAGHARGPHPSLLVLVLLSCSALIGL